MCANGFELLLGVDDLRREPVARAAHRFELGTPGQLRIKLQIDVTAQRVQSVQAALQILDKRQPRADA